MALDRFIVGDGVDAWIARVERTEGHRVGVSTDRYELCTQLAGEIVYGAPDRLRTLGRGDLGVLAPGDRYSLLYRAGDRPVFHVGLTIDPSVFGPDEPDRDVLVSGPGGPADLEIGDALAEACRARLAGTPPPTDALLSPIRRFIARRVVLSSPSPLARARNELMRTFDRALYLRHLAQVAGMRETTFLRSFARRYGITPVRLRTQLRLTHAGRRAWREPHRTNRDLAADAGFDNVAYFHRSYLAYFGATPGRHRKNDGPDRLPPDPRRSPRMSRA